MPANLVKNLANSSLLPSVFALLARTSILSLYRLALIEVPYSPRPTELVIAPFVRAFVCFFEGVCYLTHT
jgi:hypothetical protein